MSASGQTEKHSVRANVFQVAPESGPCSMQSALRIGANKRHHLSDGATVTGQPSLAVMAQRHSKASSQNPPSRRLKRGVFVSVVDDLQAASNRFVVEHDIRPKPAAHRPCRLDQNLM